MRHENNNLEKLHGWVFTYNALSDVWMAVKSENFKDLTNNFNSPNIIKAATWDTLFRVILKTQGNPLKLKRLS